jgi:pectate lyase
MAHGLLFALSLVLTPALMGAGGWATHNGTVTGGAGGPIIPVSNLTQLQDAIRGDASAIVEVTGTINLGTSNVRFGSNKTIIGIGANSGFIGNLKGVRVNNLIFRNLNFTNPSRVGDGDGLSLDGCTRVIVEYCAFVDCGDGSLDIKNGADFITVRWTKFSYTFDSGHNFANLIGHSDGNSNLDRDKLRITFHHNWWSTGVVERMPRVRYGDVHVYNNYFTSSGNRYCIRASIESEVLVENNYFEGIRKPYEYFSPNGKIRAVGNTTVNCTEVLSFNDSVFTPPYSYTLQSPADARAAIIANAGPRSGGGGTTPPSPSAPAAPSNLSASAASTSQINLSWTDNATNEAGFQLERATSAGGPFSQIATPGANTVSFQNTGLAAATTYYYRVRATNSGGNSSYSNTASATTQSVPGPAGSLQAEAATLGGGVVVENNHPGFNGSGFVNFPISGGFVSFGGVDGGAGGTATLTFRYALGTTSARTGRLIINGSGQDITFAPSGGWSTWSTLNVSVPLNAGTGNTVRLESNGQDLSNLDQLVVAPNLSSGGLQAESATLGGGVVVENNHPGFNGSGFVNFPVSGGFVTFSGVNGGTGGTATLAFRYALGATSARTGRLVVNGTGQNITFAPSGGWSTWTTLNVSVPLNAGTGNTVRLESNGQDLSNLDQLAVTPGSGGGGSGGGGGGGTATTVTFTSIGSEDGRLVESSETSNVGGSFDANANSSSALRTGDDSGNRQLKSILSFDTSSIPDGATIVSATLRLTRGSSSGTSPFTTHGALRVDIQNGNGFGGSTVLAASDFQAPAAAQGVAQMSAVTANGQVSTGSLNATGRGLINKTGKTQFRLEFELDDDNDSGNDYIGWHSGDSSTASLRPVLVIEYQ